MTIEKQTKIHGFDVLLEINHDAQDEPMTHAYIEHQRMNLSGSLEFLLQTGCLMGREDDEVEINPEIVEKIDDWCIANGY